MATNKKIIKVGVEGAEKAEKQIKKVNGGLNNMAKTAMKAAGAYFGAQALLSAVRSSIDLFGQQEEAEKKLRFAAGDMTDALIKQAEALQQNTRFGDEAIIAQQAYLASLGLSEQQIKDTISASLDLASATGMSLESAVMNTSKTLSGMAGELGEKLGPAFRELTPEMLKAGEGIKFIADQFGGTAQADAESFSGQIDQMKNAAGDAGEAMGELLAPVILKIANGLKIAAEKAQEFFQRIGETDLETTTRELEKMGASAQVIAGLRLKSLGTDLDIINAKLINSNSEYKTIEEVNQRIAELTKQSAFQTEEQEFLADKSSNYVKFLSLERAMLEFKRGQAEVDAETGEIMIRNLRTGEIQTQMSEEQLNNMILSTEVSLRMLQEQEGSYEGMVETRHELMNQNIEEIELLTAHLSDLKERQRIENEIKENKKIANQEEIEGNNVVTNNTISNIEKVDKATEKSTEKEKKWKTKLKDVLLKNEEKIRTDVLQTNEIKKAQQVRDGLSNAFLMAQEAYKALASIPFIGPALGVAAAGVAYAYGLRQVAGIQKAQYGADFVTDGPQLMMVGEGGGPERVQVTPLSDPNVDGPQGQSINLTITGNVLHESFIEDQVVPQIREAIRLGENVGI